MRKAEGQESTEAMDVFAAAREGNLERVRALIEQDAALVHATNYDWTPLLCAACAGRVEIARYLLDHGAMVNHRDDTPKTALHLACLGRGDIEIVRLLLERGADVSAIDEWDETPLMLAAGSGYDAIVRVLLEHGGSDLEAADGERWTAFHRACYRGHAGVLRQLLEAGADPTKRDSDGLTPLDLATGQGHQPCVSVLHEWDRAYQLHRVRRIRDGSWLLQKNTNDNHTGDMPEAAQMKVDASDTGAESQPSVREADSSIRFEDW